MINYRFDKYKTMILILVILSFMLTVNVEAYVETGNLSDKNYTINYPIVNIDNNKIAQNKINNDISHYVNRFKKDYYIGEFVNGTFKYKVKFENEQYISLMIIDNRYISFGAAHSMSCATCVTYDKTTGDKVPLSFFVRLVPADLAAIMALPVYDENNRILPYNENTKTDYLKSGHAEISSNYYLEDNGAIALVYQPYQLASYSHGVTHISLNSNAIDYFNRKNHQ